MVLKSMFFAYSRHDGGRLEFDLSLVMIGFHRYECFSTPNVRHNNRVISLLCHHKIYTLSCLDAVCVGLHFTCMCFTSLRCEDANEMTIRTIKLQGCNNRGV